MPLSDIIKDAEFMQSVLHTMHDGLMVVDRDGVILSFNRAAEEMTGYPSEEVIGKPCSLLDTDTCVYREGSAKKIRCSLFSDGHAVRKSCRIRAKDGREVYLLKNAAVLRDSEGRIIAGVETMTDVTSMVMKDRQIGELTRTLRKEHSFMGLVGASPAMRAVFVQIENAARSEAPVIVLGESGTGKELVAGAVHALGRRSGGPFVKVNCAALNEHLLESELFGHRKGAFTGATQDRQGRFEAASGGTIFLDEVGDMPLSMQVKLLRVLEEKEIERVGENKAVPVDIRLITATNRNLHTLVEAGDFREDLLYRVNVIPISVPPLRDRLEDLPLLVARFLERISLVNNRHIHRVSPKAMKVLESYRWPGNVRQLINTMEYSAITSNGETIEVSDLPEYVLFGRDAPHPPLRGGLTREGIASALERAGGKRTLAARHLGTSRVTLWKKMKELGMK